MVDETIARIEKEITTNKAMTESQRRELIDLVEKLKNEIESLAEKHSEDASSIAKFMETSVHEAIREEVNPVLLNHSLTGLSLSVERFEVSHPKLVGVINAIGQTLARIGI